jgi:hypothetical protein
MYREHPSAELHHLFRARPFQGAVPEEAEFVFVGLDANYAEEIDAAASFAHILEYQHDGIAFWRRHRVHHPFLLPGYHGDGRRYHLNFARIGFTPGDAQRVSFIELLDVPTTGRSQLTVDDLAPPHLARIDALIRRGDRRRVFVSAGVLRLMAESKQFGWLRPRPRTSELLPVLHARGNTNVYLHLHFSNYGKFQARLEHEATLIAHLAIKPQS